MDLGMLRDEGDEVMSVVKVELDYCFKSHVIFKETSFYALAMVKAERLVPMYAGTTQTVI